MQRKLLWDHLVITAELRDSPWFITGDFNDLVSNGEKVGGPERPEGSFSDFRTFLAEGDLFDIQHTRDFLSWKGQRGVHYVRCRLDRAAANTSWAERFPTARCVYLPYESSDHKPLLSIFEPARKKRRGLFWYDRRLKNNPKLLRSSDLPGTQRRTKAYWKGSAWLGEQSHGGTKPNRLIVESLLIKREKSWRKHKQAQ